MLQGHAPLRAAVRTEIAPAWNASWKTNHLIVDELGGFGLYCSEPELTDNYDPYGTPVASYHLPENAVLAVGVCPPKPYDWERSLREQVIWHWSNVTSYPPDEDLRAWKPLWQRGAAAVGSHALEGLEPGFRAPARHG